MTKTPKYTVEEIDEIDTLRQQGLTWEQIAQQKGKARSVLFTAYKRYAVNGYWRPQLPWRTIESMPFDVPVLVYGKGTFAVAIRTEQTSHHKSWTHWMPLPQEPK